MKPVTRRTTFSRDVRSQPPKSAIRLAWLAMAFVVVVILVLHFTIGHATHTNNAIRSGLSGVCLDVHRSGTTSGTPIDTASCNGSGAQAWVTTATTIREEGTNNCVAANADGAIILASCATVPGQVWLRDQQGYFNPNTTNCLNAPSVGAQLQLASCNSLSSSGETWSPARDAQTPACSGNKGDMVACETVTQWDAWQTEGSSHEALLTTYTDGTPYEEWCADFVSYIYKQAGYPFTSGSADGWDENNSNNVQYMGFTMHAAGSGYVPKTGDVAFFNYPGGHVEIVVSGGLRPSFVYGDSAERDPTTGNGQMKANTITQDGEEGSVVYYLTPSS